MRQALLICCLGLLSTSAFAEQCPPSSAIDLAQQLEQKLTSYTLDNGLTVNLLPLADQHTISAASQFNVGSRNEDIGQTGYAHLFEHLLFKGSQHAPADSYPKLMSNVGARFNASTHFDYTNYFATFPSQALNQSVFLDADRFQHPSLSQQTVANQQAAVLEEIATTIDSQPYFRVAMNFLLKQVADTPYAHAVIGSKADVMAATAEDLNAFHQRFYQPQNMTLSLVGDLPENTRNLIEQHFGSWQGDVNDSENFEPLNINAQATYGKVYDKRGPWPAVLLAWHTVGRGHPDAEAILLLNQLLFSHQASLLQQAEHHHPLSLLNYSFPMAMENHGVANIVLVPRANVSLDTLTATAESLIQQVIKNGVEPQLFCRVKHRAMEQVIQRYRSAPSVAKTLSNQQQRDQPTPLSAPLMRINQVSAADIQRVALQYYNDKTIRLDLLPPWYIRSGKTLLEWLPESLVESLEDSVL